MTRLDNKITAADMTNNLLQDSIPIAIPWIKCLPALAICILLFSSAKLTAEIYTWQDAQGHTHFGDRPPAESRATEHKLRINTYTSPKIKPLSGITPSKDLRKVVMYSTEWCGVCKTAKRYFKERKIPFREYDVEKSRKGESDFKRLRGQGVPIILVGKQRLNGFSTARFESIYKQK